jgi:hypothetical protein
MRAGALAQVVAELDPDVFSFGGMALRAPIYPAGGVHGRTPTGVAVRLHQVFQTQSLTECHITAKRATPSGRTPLLDYDAPAGHGTCGVVAPPAASLGTPYVGAPRGLGWSSMANQRWNFQPWLVRTTLP